MDIHIFQILAIQKPRLMLRLLSKTKTYDVFNVLDLEDALWDVTKPEHTLFLKARARSRLNELAKTAPDSFAQYQLGVRVNRITSPEFQLDLETLATISKVAPISCLLLPKVTSPQDIYDYLELLAAHQVICDQVVPIIETRAGLANLTAIVSEAAMQQIRFAVYGHYDYSLDIGSWPFLEHEEEAFWDHITPIIRKIEAGGLGYVHPPYFQIYADDHFAGIIQRLSSLCRRGFAVLTLGTRQTSICQAHSKDDPPPDFTASFRATQSLDEQARVQLAESVIDVFEHHRKDGNSFALDPRTGRFISPHIYVAACKFLGVAEFAL